MPASSRSSIAPRALACACAVALLAAAPASAQVDVDVGAPSLPGVPAPQAPSVPDVRGTVDDVRETVNGTVERLPGAGRSNPSAAPPAPSGGGGGTSGGGGGTTSDPVAAASPQGDGGGGAGPRGGAADRGAGRERSGDRDRRRARRERESRRRADRSAAGRRDTPAVDAAPAARGADGADSDDEGSGVTRTLERVVEVVPGPIKIALLLLALLAVASLGRSQLHARRAKRLSAQREELLKDVGLLQQALLPEIPAKLGDLATSVAYRPADGPAAGGDFYDAFLLDGERVAIIVGDVSGHGRSALARTALMRYTLRAYLDAGLEPRRALQVAGKALDDDLGGDFATVVLAIHDPARATLTYASAGHPPPIVTGSGAFDPVTVLSSPPIGAGLPTGQRQTTLHLPGDAVACFFTDGLVEAKDGDDLVGRERLAAMLADLGPQATAHGLIDAVAVCADETPDDMAACVVRPDAAGAVDHVPDRVEEIELTGLDLPGDRVERFMAACDVEPGERAAARRSVEASVREFGAALLRVRVDRTGARCEVESVASLHDPLGAPLRLPDAAALRAGAGTDLV